MSGRDTMPGVADAFARPTPRRARNSRAAARRRGLAVESRVLPGHAGVDGEALAIDLVLLGPRTPSASSCHVGDARRRGLLRLRVPGRAAARRRLSSPRSRAPALRCCSSTRSIRTASRTCAASTRTTSTSTATSATSRAPPARNAAYAEVHAFMLPATWPPDDEDEAALGALRREAWRARAPGGAHRRPVRLSRRACSSAARARPGATARCARCCARTLRQRAARRWIDFHTALGPLGHGEKIYAGRDDAATLARDAAIVGRRRHVVLRWLVDVGEGRRHRTAARRYEECRRRRVHRDRRSSTARCRCAGAPGAARRPLARTHPEAPADAARADQAADARRVLRRRPTNGRRWSSRRRASPRCRPLTGLAS